MTDKMYLCIDLKSFFASVECVERGLDPFKTNLAVADPARGSGTICLAITPAMKDLGIKNRCRVFEIPSHIKYIKARPRMSLYMKYSADIYGTYLNYISKYDIYIYSIDECFIDITSYLKVYHKTPKELAIMLMDAVFKKTGICATAGIGTNLFLAKVALDVTAKHVPDHIGYLDEEEFKKQIWHHKPMTDIWSIGKGVATRLNHLGLYDLYDVSQCDPRRLYKEFGVNAEFLIDHSKGIEPCTIKEIKEYKSKSNSISNGQILFEDYKYEDAKVVLTEMVELPTLEMNEKDLSADGISLMVGYSKDCIPATGGSRKISRTNSYSTILKEVLDLYSKSTDKHHPIRKLNVGLNNLLPETFIQYGLFDNPELNIKEKKVQNILMSIKNKYGKNAILRGISFEEKATGRERNKMVGGHNSE